MQIKITETEYEIAPCPFCGNYDRSRITVNSKTRGYTWERRTNFQVACNICWARGPHGEDIEQAIIKWDKR